MAWNKGEGWGGGSTKPERMMAADYEKINLPQVINPETGQLERVGRGRTAVFETGKLLVAEVVQVTEPSGVDDEVTLVDELSSTGDLSHGA